MSNLCPTPEKQAHPNANAAWRQARTRLNRGRGSRTKLVAYQCVCGAWHVGHTTDGNRRRKIKDAS